MECENYSPYRTRYVHNYKNKSINFMHREMFYQLHTTWTTNTDNQLVKNDMNVNEHEGLFNITLRHKLK